MAQAATAAKTYFWGTGRRKSSVARVRVRPGTGEIQINKKKLTDYFSLERDRNRVLAPLRTTSMLGRLDVFVNVNGGGTTGQAGAVLMGLARALVAIDENLETLLRPDGFLSRDPRMVERKKYGRRKARRSFQFSKR